MFHAAQRYICPRFIWLSADPPRRWPEKWCPMPRDDRGGCINMKLWDVPSRRVLPPFAPPGRRCVVCRLSGCQIEFAFARLSGLSTESFARLLVLVAGRGFEPRRGTQGASRQPIDIGVKERGECASHEVGSRPRAPPAPAMSRLAPGLFNFPCQSPSYPPAEQHLSP